MRRNRYSGRCIKCGCTVAAQAGRYVGFGRFKGTWCPACEPRPPARADHDGWHRTTLAALDFETTGVNPQHDRVVSFALIRHGSEAQSGLINPGVPIPAAATRVHGISEQMICDAAAPSIQIARISAWVQDLANSRIPLVVFNAGYDLAMLSAECRRHNVSEPDWRNLIVIDPYVVDWALTRGELGPRKLSDVCDYYQVELAEAHQAHADAQAALDVAIEIARCYPAIASRSHADLMTDQRRWVVEQTTAWNAYARTAGRRVEEVGYWPVDVSPM